MRPVHPLSDSELAGPRRQAKASVRVKRFMQPPADLAAELRTDWAVMPGENEVV